MADSFQPDSFQPDVPEDPKKKKPAPPVDSFQADSFQPDTPEEKPESPEYAALHKEMERDSGKGIVGGIVSNIKESPGLVSKRTSEEDVAAIAKQRGVDPQELGKYASFLGAAAYGEPTDVSEIGKEVVGSVARGPLLGIPQWIVKKLQSDPKMRDAMDDLRELADKRRSLLGGVSENILPASKGGKAAKEVVLGGKEANLASRAATVAKGAGVGATAGVANSKEGEEVQGGVTGGIVGGFIGTTVEGTSALINRRANKAARTAAEKEVIESAPRLQENDVQKAASEVAEKTKDSEQLMEKSIFGDKSPASYTDEEASAIIQEQLGPRKLADIEQHQADAFERFADESSEIHNSKKALDQKIEETSARLEDLQAKQERTGYSSDYLEKHSDKLERQIDSLSNAINRDTNKEVSILKRADNAATDEEIKAMKDYAGQIREEKAEKGLRLGELERRKAKLDAMLDRSASLEKENKALPGQAEKLQAQLDRLTEQRKALGETPSKELPSLVKEKVAQEVVEKRAIDFVDYILGERPKSYQEAVEALRSSNKGQDFFKKSYQDFVRSEHALRGADEKQMKSFNQGGTFSKIADAASGNQWVLRGIDDKNNVGARQGGADLSNALTRKTHPQRVFTEGLVNLWQQAPGKIKGLLKDGAKLIAHYEKNGTAGMSPELTRVMEQYASLNKKFFDFIRKQNGAGDKTISAIEPKFRPNFVPAVTKDIADVVVLINMRVRQALREATMQTGRKIEKLSELSEAELSRLIQSNKAAKDLAEALTAFKPEVPHKPISFSNAVEDMINTKKGNHGIETVARTLEERQDKIPDFLRETNIFKAQLKYFSNTLNYMYTREPIARLKNTIAQLRKIGADTDADFIERMVRDTLYTRPNSIASGVQSARIGYGKLLSTLEEKHGKYAPDVLAVRMAGNLASGIANMKSNIYYNMLGWFSVRAAVQNSAGVIATTIPELGPKYGVSAVARGALNTVLNYKRLIEKARAMGSVPADVVSNAEDLLAEGFRASVPMRLPARAYRKLAQAGMVFYQGVERANRALMFGTAEIMAQDLKKQSPNALNSLAKFPADLRKTILANADNPEVTSELIGKHLNNVTQFNYNKAELAEVARVLGPLAVFTKWPTEMMGKAIYNARSGGAVRGNIRNFEYFMTSYLLLQGIDAGISHVYNKKPEMSDRQKKVFGSQGLSQSAPLGSLQSVGTGEVFTPPIVDIIYQDLIDPIKKKQDPRTKHLVGSLVEKYAPGAGAVRFVTDDIVTMVTGHRPEGADFFEKTQEGAKQLKKLVK